MNHFIAIAGSNRHGSTNKKLIKFMKERYAKVAEIEILRFLKLRKRWVKRLRLPMG